MYALRLKKSLLSLHVQTQSAYPIPPLSCLFPPLCKTGISKDTLVPKQSAAMGGAPTCQHSVHTHPTKVGVTLATFPTTIMHAALKLAMNAMLFTAHICSATPLMWKAFFQSGLQTSLTTMSRPVKPTPVEEVEGGKKTGPGECLNQGLLSSPLTFKREGNETAVSKMTCNIPCQGIHQREALKADTNS